MDNPSSTPGTWLAGWRTGRHGVGAPDQRPAPREPVRPRCPRACPAVVPPATRRPRESSKQLSQPRCTLGSSRCRTRHLDRGGAVLQLDTDLICRRWRWRQRCGHGQGQEVQWHARRWHVMNRWTLHGASNRNSDSPPRMRQLSKPSEDSAQLYNCTIAKINRSPRTRYDRYRQEKPL